MQFMGVDRVVNEIELRKFRQLKISVLWLQKEQKFGRYCYYGCYCLPEGSHNIAAGGYGKPQVGLFLGKMENFFLDPRGFAKILEIFAKIPENCKKK